MAVKINNASILARAREGAMRGVVMGTELVRMEAVSLIQNGQKTGRVYRRGGVAHQASAPGEAPASDTGMLVNSIETRYNVSELSGTVVATAAYAPHLEYGTRNMEPRPFMRPALANKQAEVERIVQAEIEKALL